MRLHATVLATALAAAVLGLPSVPATAGVDRAPVSQLRGNQSTPPTELTGNGPTPVPLKNMAMIVDTEWGPRFVAGQQKSKLTVTVSGTDTITFRDKGTKAWKEGRKYMPRHCTKEEVKKGIQATCTILPKFQNGMFVQIWPRLGNDRIDGSQLPSWVRFWVLTDKGNDLVWGGAGDDFVNGGQGKDSVHGGDGDDWIRTGIENDKIWGDEGDDNLVGVDGNDEIHGGPGDDQMGGGPGDDKLWGEDGTDRFSCSSGQDTTDAVPGERTSECEAVFSFS